MKNTYRCSVLGGGGAQRGRGGKLLLEDSDGDYGLMSYVRSSISQMIEVNLFLPELGKQRYKMTNYNSIYTCMWNYNIINNSSWQFSKTDFKGLS